MTVLRREAARKFFMKIQMSNSFLVDFNTREGQKLEKILFMKIFRSPLSEKKFVVFPFLPPKSRSPLVVINDTSPKYVNLQSISFVNINYYVKKNVHCKFLARFKIRMSRLLCVKDLFQVLILCCLKVMWCCPKNIVSFSRGGQNKMVAMAITSVFRHQNPVSLCFISLDLFHENFISTEFLSSTPPPPGKILIWHQTCETRCLNF